MNTIIVDKENNIDIKDNVINLEIGVKKLSINVKGLVLINEIGFDENSELELELNIEPKTHLIYNRLMKHKVANEKIIINQDSNSKVEFNYSLRALDQCNLIIDSNLNGNDNNTSIYIKAVTEDMGKCIIESTADTKEKIQNNSLIEGIKVLNLNDEESVCIPNLLVASNEIEVNHACSISGINQEYLFYLNSKGISTNNAIKLIKKGYLLSNLDINDEILKGLEEKIEKIMEVN